MATSEIDLIVQRARKLSTVEVLNLIQKLSADARVKIQAKEESEKQPPESRGLVYGKYANTGRRMSTEEDFKIAEYHFNEDEWK